MAYSGWDIVDSLLEALPLGLVVTAMGLVALAINPGVISWQIVFALSGLIVAIEFAYQMNLLMNPRYASSNKQSIGLSSPNPKTDG